MPTFADLLGQLHNAHKREVEALQKELRSTKRKVTKQNVSESQGTSPVVGMDPSSVQLGTPSSEIPGTIQACEPRENGAQDGSVQATLCESVNERPPLTSPGWVNSVASEKTEESDEGDLDLKGGDSILHDYSIKWNPFAEGGSAVSEFLTRYFNAGEKSRKRRRAYKIVKSLKFSVMSYVAIVLNSLFIGISMQFQMNAAIAQNEHELSPWWEYIEYLFVVFFTLELVAKVLAEDLHIFFGPDWQWNLLDATLVLAALIQLLMENAYGKEAPNLTFSRTVRLFRVTRVLRVIRVVRICQSLRVMIFAIFRSLGALLWVLAVLLFFKYIFAMIFMHGAIMQFRAPLNMDPLSPGGFENGQAHRNYLEESWGTIDKAIVTLFESITGGRDWGEVYYSLVHVSMIYGMLFLCYIYFMMFLVLNVVIGTVVDVTSGVSKRDRDRMVEEEMKALKDYASDIKEFFQQADADNSGQLSWDEFREHLQDNRVKAYFQTLDLDIRQAHTLFKLLDCNDNGEVGIEEFLDGCVRLKGAARSLDLNLVIYQLESIIKGTSLINQQQTADPETGEVGSNGSRNSTPRKEPAAAANSAAAPPGGGDSTAVGGGV